MPEPDAAGRLLAWHHDRRSRGTPTVSTLVGPPGLGGRAVRAWAGPRPVVQTDATDLTAVSHAWLAAALDGGLVAAAVAWVGRAAGRPIDPGRVTRFDVEELRRQTGPGPADPVAAVAFAVLHRAAGGGAVDGPGVVEEVAAGPGGAADPGRVFAGAAGLDASVVWPVALLVPPADAGPGWFPAAAGALERVAAAAPGVPVAVAVAAADYARSAGDPSRPVALAREGEVPVPGVAADAVSALLTAAGADPTPHAAAVAKLVGRGLDAAGAAAFVAAVTEVPPVGPDEPGCRSAAERFLYDLLESTPATAGLFRPNQPLPFHHGTRAGEADLLAAGVKVAVEVDGAYYHLTPEQYRADRRKDYSYHQHGYLVLRFLAEDVVSDMEFIMERITAAVADRRAGSPAEGR